MQRRSVCRWMGPGMAFLLGAAPAPALEFENGGLFDPARHERFAAGSFPAAPVPNPGFFLAAYEAQLSGVGWQTSQPHKKAALVSPRHFLNADHYKLGGSITFVGWDGVLRTYPIASNERVSGDVAIGTLAEPIPPEDAIHFFPVAAVRGSEHDGREVLYVGKAPSAGRFAAGRTAVAVSAQSSNRLDSTLVDPVYAGDRVYGVPGDSGSPSFFEQDGGLVLVGHHFGGHNDQYLGYRPTRDAVDDYLAADGNLLDVIGEGWLGDPADGALVVTRLSEQGGIHLVSGGLGASATWVARIHDFSGSGSQVRVDTEGGAFWLREPTTGSLVRERTLSAPLDGAGVAVEVVLAAPAAGGYEGTLYVAGSGSHFAIPLSGDAVDAEPSGADPDPDLSPPTAPSNLTASGNWRGSRLSWTASADDVGVVGYGVVRDGLQVGLTSGTRYDDGPFERGRAYVYSVFALDAAGNASPESAPLTVVNGQEATVADAPASGGGSCRPSRRKETGRFCRDGVDNDCDGAADSADPDC